MFAARAAQDKTIINLLLEKGADPHMADSNGNTLLMYAAKRGLNDLVKVLIKNKADLHHTNKEGKSVLSFAKDDSMAKHLLSSGCSFKGLDKTGVINSFNKNPIKSLLDYHKLPKDAEVAIEHWINKNIYPEINNHNLLATKECLHSFSYQEYNNFSLDSLCGKDGTNIHHD